MHVHDYESKFQRKLCGKKRIADLRVGSFCALIQNKIGGLVKALQYALQYEWHYQNSLMSICKGSRTHTSVSIEVYFYAACLIISPWLEKKLWVLYCRKYRPSCPQCYRTSRMKPMAFLHTVLASIFEFEFNWFSFYGRRRAHHKVAPISCDDGDACCKNGIQKWTQKTREDNKGIGPSLKA